MTKDHQTDADDLLERLDDSKGWPNLGKAAAKRIRLDAEVIKAADALASHLEIVGLSEGLDCVTGPLLDAFRQAHGRHPRPHPRRSRGELE